MPAAKRTARARKRATTTKRTILGWLPYWENELGARGCSPRTLQNQAKCLKRLTDFLGDVEATAVTPEDLEAWRDWLSESEALKPSSVNRYLLTVGTFYNWLADERAVDESPILSVDLIRSYSDDAPPVLDEPTRARLVKGATKGVKRARTGWLALRDEAIISLLFDTGLRASECAGLLLEHLDLSARQVFVHDDIAKGHSARTVVFGFKTARAIARYLRERDAQAYAFLPELFIGQRGRATYTVVRDCVRKAGLREGVIGMRPHLLRHTFAHEMKAAGASDEVLMSLAGWRTTAMLRRYGRAERTARAVDAYQRIGSPVDRAAGTRNTRSA